MVFHFFFCVRYVNIFPINWVKFSFSIIFTHFTNCVMMMLMPFHYSLLLLSPSPHDDECTNASVHILSYVCLFSVQQTNYTSRIPSPGSSHPPLSYWNNILCAENKIHNWNNIFSMEFWIVTERNTKKRRKEEK